MAVYRHQPLLYRYLGTSVVVEFGGGYLTHNAWWMEPVIDGACALVTTAALPHCSCHLCRMVVTVLVNGLDALFTNRCVISFFHLLLRRTLPPQLPAAPLLPLLPRPRPHPHTPRAFPLTTTPTLHLPAATTRTPRAAHLMNILLSGLGGGCVGCYTH